MAVVTTTVEWAPERLEFLLPATTEFQRRVELCTFPDSTERTYTITFRIAVTSRSFAETNSIASATGKPSNGTSETFAKAGSAASAVGKTSNRLSAASRTSWANKMLVRSAELTESSERRLVARYALRVVNDRQLLETRFGNFLIQKRLAVPCVALSIFMMVLLYFFSPGKSKLTVIGKADSPSVSINKHHILTMLTASILMFLAIFISAHNVSRGLLQLTLRSFDVWCMFFSHLTQEGIHLYNIILLCNDSGEADNVWIGVQITQRIVGTCGVFFVCHVDANIISRFWKAMITLAVIFLFSQKYWASRLGNIGWHPSHEICWYNGCTSLQDVYQLSLAHMLLFMVKALVLNLMGRELAFIHSHYVECKDQAEAYDRLKEFALFEHYDFDPVSTAQEKLENIDTLVNIVDSSTNDVPPRKSDDDPTRSHNKQRFPPISERISL